MLENLHRLPRKLTRFICDEMLYEYHTGSLDIERRKAVENYIARHPEVKEDLKALSLAMQYGENLGQTKVSSKYLLELHHAQPVGAATLNKLKWKNWPEVMRWASEAFIISACVMVIGFFVPWGSIKNIFPDHADPPPMMNTAPLDTSRPLENMATSARVEAKQALLPAGDAASTVKESPSSAPTPPPEPKKAARPMGVLYSISMNAPYDPTEAEAIRVKLLQYGATKSGQVELGWRKTKPSGSYYHFTVPEIYYRNIIQDLEQYGSVRVYKNEHPRLMPEGQIRVILWIEDVTEPANATEPQSLTEEGAL